MRFTVRLISSFFCTAAGARASASRRFWWIRLPREERLFWALTCSDLTLPTSFCCSLTSPWASASLAWASPSSARTLAMSAARKASRARCTRDLSPLTSRCRSRYFSASSRCSFFCLRSAWICRRLLNAKLICSSASFFSASRRSKSSRSASDPDTCSIRRVRSRGLREAMLSTSPWKTRKLRALVWIPRSASRSLYVSQVTTRPSQRYSEPPATEHERSSRSSRPDARRRTTRTEALAASGRCPSRECTRSASWAPRSCAERIPSAKLMASMTLLFPEPFGPTIAVKPLKGPTVCLPA